MEDEILRQKYRILREKLYVIRNKMNDLVEIHNKTYNNLREAIIIDNKIFKEDSFFENKKVEQHILNELNSTIIPNVNNKI